VYTPSQTDSFDGRGCASIAINAETAAMTKRKRLVLGPITGSAI
jgi:hypothetical protein